jgi:toxin ParE1/3/4
MEVVWTQRAFRHLNQIQDFIGAHSPHAAEALINDILDRTDALLSSNPHMGRPGRVAGTRELVLSRTHYLVVYTVGASVEILAVLHQAREWPRSFP